MVWFNPKSQPPSEFGSFNLQLVGWKMCEQIGSSPEGENKNSWNHPDWLSLVVLLPLDLRCEQILGHSSHHFRSQKCPSWLFKMQYNLVLRNHKSSGQLVLFKFCTSSIALTWPRNNLEHVKAKAMQLILLFFSFDFHLQGFRLFGLKTGFGKDEKVD